MRMVGGVRGVEVPRCDRVGVSGWRGVVVFFFFREGFFFVLFAGLYGGIEVFLGRFVLFFL